MITLFYVSSTLLQSRRINQVCQKIGEHLGQKASITFYALPGETEDGFDVNFATSELCFNRNGAKVTEILWLLGNRRGCSLAPVQCIHATPWITFPQAPSWLPFAYKQTSEVILERLKGNRNVLHLLLEMGIQPSHDNEHGNLGEVVELENYGKLIAWKMDSHLALIIATDVEYFTKLLIATFLQNNFLVNDQLPLLRIESILTEGTPQPFEQLCKHLKKPTRISASIDQIEWKKHLDGLRALTVLAGQATEFEYNKNRTEGKIGVVIKPDLIPQEQKLKKQTDSPSGHQVVSPKKLQSRDSPSRAVAIEHGHKLLPSDVKASTSKAAATKATSESRFASNKIADSPTPPHAPSEPIAPTVSNSKPTTNSKSETKTASTSTPPSELEKLAAAAKAKASPVHSSGITKTESSGASQTPASSPGKSSTTVTATVHSSSTTKSTSNTPKKPEVNVKTAASNSVAPSSTSAAASISSQADYTKRPSLKRSKDSLKECKPLNILVYSDSSSARDSTVATLRDIVEPNMYTIYPLTPQQVADKHWLQNTALLVVCGSVVSSVGEILVDYFLHGGKVLSLCSDILHFVLPTYRTAEVREHELVQFSYDKWQKVKMMHHIFCYQPSPVKKHFSTESEESTQSSSRKSALVCPRSIELKDLHGQSYNLDVQVLGSEETWKTPSLLLASSRQSGGKAVFSQIHLETSPSQFEADEMRYAVLKQNEKIRLEIFADLLSKHLKINVKSGEESASAKYVYQQAYFLGRHESKFELLEKLKPQIAADNTISTPNLTMSFCGKNEIPPKANNNLLPILIHSCPDDFSTVDYFDNLKTSYIGRLLIYAPLVNSTMNVINKLELTNGIVVLARQQSDGVGRSQNQWLSPLGCAMFSIQLHLSLSSPLGSRLPILQHLVAVSMINCLKRHEVYKYLDLGVKWPNDIYAYGLNKIGGLIVQTTLIGQQAIVNVGCGINLDNSKPTTCINDMISDYNQKLGPGQKQIPPLKYEQFLALIFNEIERLVEQVQTGNFEDFYRLYYELWLHCDQSIQISDRNGQLREALVVGIDDYGYLKVKLTNGGSIETVQPDGNSFDMLKGLIVPKYN